MKVLKPFFRKPEKLNKLLSLKNLFTPNQLAVLERIDIEGRTRGLKIFLVGGVLRDSLLGRPSSDFDLVIEGDGIGFAKQLANDMSLEIKEHPAFLTAKLIGFNEDVSEVDIATAREEIYPLPGSLPVVRPSTLEKDLGRRDFTINTLTCALSDLIRVSQQGGNLRSIIQDQFGGLVDLDAKIIKILHPDSFRDDPTRIFRAARYAARIGGNLDNASHAAAEKELENGALQTISYYRIGNEIRWILAEEFASAALETLVKFNIFEKLGFGDSPVVANVVSILRYAKDSAPKQNLPYERMEIPVFMLLMTPSLSEESRDKLFLDWGFGKRGVSRAREALLSMGIKP